ncbi:MAG: CBS domain-containing protein [Alphaproteobacteria bacterium]|nr:CBS domain-containing protein [Alphaproteobacteria bacterium]
MRVRDIMTSAVITVGPDVPVSEIARQLVEHRISALPVVDGEGRLLGIVSERDLLRRHEIGTEGRHSRWVEFLLDDATLAREYQKSHGARARDVMTRHLACIGEDAGLADLAELMETRKVKRVPVVRDGRLVGIVSRADMVRQIAKAALAEKPAQGKIGDAEIRAELEKRMARESWVGGMFLQTSVQDGVVEFSGLISAVEKRDALRALAEAVPGVSKVVDNTRVGQLNIAP